MTSQEHPDRLCQQVQVPIPGPEAQKKSVPQPVPPGGQ